MTVTNAPFSTSTSYTISGSWTYTSDLTLSKNDPKIIFLDGASEGSVQNISGNMHYDTSSPNRDHKFYGDGVLKITLDMGDPSVKINSIKIIGTQQSAIADATDAATAISQLNLFLAAARTHGLIAS